MSQVEKNIELIRKNIDDARGRSITGEEVKLIAVTKTHGVDLINEALQCGITSIGENRVQEVLEKYVYLPNDLDIHLIGTLQRNKVKYIIDKVQMIHSLDKLSLAEEIDKRAEANGIKMDCLIQVNIGKEDSKRGVFYEDTQYFIENCLEYVNINLRGLMCIGPITEDVEYLHSLYRKMYQLKEKIKNYYKDELNFDILSMGMTSDYEIAIEEGSNMVRIGSAIFGSRN